MKKEFIIQKGCPSLVLFFAGWGMDTRPFQYTDSKCDLCIYYDYRTLDGFSPEDFGNYKEIYLIAWSMGVWAAGEVLQYQSLPLCESIAINGTPYPVNDEWGIPTDIFNGTLNGLNERNLQKFNLRMCGTSETWKAFQATAPMRPIEELKDELAGIGKMQAQLPVSSFTWNKAVIGKNDHIFQSDNQLRAWKLYENTEIIETTSAHYDAQLFRQYLTHG